MRLAGGEKRKLYPWASELMGKPEGENTAVGNHLRQPWGPSEGHAKAQSIKGDMARGAPGF